MLDPVDAFVAIQNALGEITERSVGDVVSEIRDSELLACDAGVDSIARALHLAVKFRPLSIPSYIAVLAFAECRSLFSGIRVSLLRTIFHYLNTSYGFPSESGSLAFLFHSCPSLYSES